MWSRSRGAVLRGVASRGRGFRSGRPPSSGVLRVAAATSALVAFAGWSWSRATAPADAPPPTTMATVQDLMRSGQLLEDAGHLTDALHMYRRARTTAEKHYGPYSYFVAGPAQSVSNAMLGQPSAPTGEIREAIGLLMRAHDIARGAEDAPSEEVRLAQLGSICYDLGQAWTSRNDHAQAAVWFDKAIGYLSGCRQSKHCRVQNANCKASLSASLFYCGRHPEAERAARSAIEDASPDSDAMMTASFNLGMILKAKGGANLEAHQLLARAVRVAKRRGAKPNAELIDACDRAIRELDVPEHSF
ncbi:MalT-like TPR region domain-containing protein [Plasmodiophora brassicae]